MRELSRKRKFRADQELDRERREHDAAQLKKARLDNKTDPSRPPAVGARGLARRPLPITNPLATTLVNSTTPPSTTFATGPPT
jgi:hypothetical protein